MNNTLINYHYQDASNHKVYSENIVLEGTLLDEEKYDLMLNFEELYGFIPSKIGLKDLQSELQKYDTSFNDDDHPFHQLDLVESTNLEPTHELKAKDFYKKMMTTKWVDK